MNTDRNKYLTEAMGECWHESEFTGMSYYLEFPQYKCKKCGVGVSELCATNNDFSTWPLFGRLWKWAQDQDWLIISNHSLNCYAMKYENKKEEVVRHDHINPDRFANAVYEFLKGREA